MGPVLAGTRPARAAAVAASRAACPPAPAGRARRPGQVGVAGGRGQRRQRRAWAAPGGSTSTARPPGLHLGEVAGRARCGLAAHRLLQRLGGHERVAVAVAAHPRAHAAPGARRAGRGRATATAARPARPRSTPGPPRRATGRSSCRPSVDLVAQPQPRQPQQRRLPQGQHRPPQVAVPLRQLVGVDLAAVPAADQLDHPPLHLEDRLAPDLGGVGGEDGADEGAAPAPRPPRRRRGRRRRAVQRPGQAPVAGPASRCGGGSGGGGRAWRSSARLASSEKCENARTTCRASR